jgi:hypothetical protein
MAFNMIFYGNISIKYQKLETVGEYLRLFLYKILLREMLRMNKKKMIAELKSCEAITYG